MQITTKFIPVLLAALCTLALADSVFARGRYLHPTLGRFMTRDPVGETMTPATQQLTAFLPRNSSAVFSQAEAAAQRKIAARLGMDSMASPHIWKYADGMSLYEYQQSTPINSLDPSGYAQWVRTGIKWCTGYMVKPDIDLWNLLGVHDFLMVDGVGWGFYAKSHAGGPPDSSGGIGVISTIGTVVSGDEQKYPNAYGLPGQQTYSRCHEYLVDEACCKGGAKRFHDAVAEGVLAQGHDLPYGALTANCKAWAGGVVAAAKDKACPSSWLNPWTWGQVKLE